MSERRCDEAIRFLVQLHIDSVGRTLEEKQFTRDEGYEIMEAQLKTIKQKLGEYGVKVVFDIRK